MMPVVYPVKYSISPAASAAIGSGPAILDQFRLEAVLPEKPDIAGDEDVQKRNAERRIGKANSALLGRRGSVTEDHAHQGNRCEADRFHGTVIEFRLRKDYSRAAEKLSICARAIPGSAKTRAPPGSNGFSRAAPVS
jgi:hypothetical protein